MSVNTDVEELINYLESKDLEIVHHFKNVAQEKLYTSKNMSLLGLLLDRYIQTKSDVLLELLIGINDVSSLYLFDRLNDHLKHGAYNEVCTILFSVVKKQPSWLHKIIGTSLFATFLKCLKNEFDIVFIMRGILILCSLIPCVPAIIGPYHGDLLEVFVRTAGFITNKSTGIPEVCILHLNVGIYIFFQRLYTMYPNNFLSYMRSCFGGSRRKDPVFQEVIKPMFEFVKFHPDLITDTPKSETGLEKWKVYQPHDVLAECQKISLDQNDLVKEATYAVYDPQAESQLLSNGNGEADLFYGLNSYFTQPHSVNSLLNVKKDASDNESLRKHLATDISLCNPSEICGLTTPPLSITPSNSMHDVSSLQGGNSDSKGSSQMASDIAEQLRRSSGDTCSNSSNPSPRPTVKKTKSFGSADNFSHRAMIKSLLSNSTYNSTPIEGRPCINTSAPASPKKNFVPSKRPQSTEFFRYKRDLSKQMELGLNMDSFSIQSAPSSPMLPPESSLFSYNKDADGHGKFKSHEELMETREKIKSSYMLPCHSLNHDLPSSAVNATDKNYKHCNCDTSGVHHEFSFFKSIRQMFVEIFPKATKSCLDSCDTTRYDTIPYETSSLTAPHVIKKRSPMNLLDDFIQYGSDIHSYQLSRVPLTSQLDTDWTYFGGTTPVDELRILQTQVQLFYIQLQYERYKCELHCLRNRRLFGSLQKAQKAHEEVDTLKDQIRLAEIKLKEMKLALEIKCEENREIKQQTGIREQEYMEKIVKLEELNGQLEYKLKNCKLKKKEETRKVTILQQELQKVRYQLFDAKQNYAHIQPNLKQISHYQDVTNALEKELLILYEKQEGMKSMLKEREVHSNHHIDLEQQLVAHRNELRVLQEEKETLHMVNESLKLKSNELELSNTRKDSTILEYKLSAKKLRSKHKAEIEALESRFESCRKTSQSLQSYIASLFAKLEQPRTCQASAQTHSSANPLNSHIPSKCGERCRKISYPGMGKSHISHHDHSHRHSMQSAHTSENPFRCKKQCYINDNHCGLQSDIETSREDSGIEQSRDMSRDNDEYSNFSS